MRRTFLSILPSCRSPMTMGIAALMVCLVAVLPDQSASHPIMDLHAPQAIAVDPEHGYFIANANGDPGTRANKGFITKLDKDGQVLDLHFIQGGQGEVVLHSPVGMAIVGNRLYVADLDAVRAFDKTTGRPVLILSLRQHHAEGLTGMVTDGNGQLFVSDPESNTIFRIDTTHDHAISVLARDPLLSKPRGLAIHPRTRHLIGVSWENGKIFEIDEQGLISELMANTFFSRPFYNLDGAAFDRYGTLYVSDFTAGKIWRIYANFTKKEVIAEFLISPASISVDQENHLILVPYLYANGAEINGLERPSNAPGKKRKRRTLSDYGLGWLNPD